MSGIGDVDALLEGRLPVLDWTKDAFTGEAAGGLHSPLYVAGTPGAGSAPSAGINGAAVLNGRSGTLAAPAAVAGKSCYLNFADFISAAGVDYAYVIDRLWENSGLSVTSTSSQALTPADLPPRDANNAILGVGVGIALEIVTATGNGSPVNATVTYTNSSGTGGKTATVSIPATTVAGTWLPFPLAAGDYGVRFPTAFQLAATLTSGAISLVMFKRWGRKLRVLSGLPVDTFGPVDGGHPIPDGAAPQFIYHLTATSVGATDAAVEFSQA